MKQPIMLSDELGASTDDSLPMNAIDIEEWDDLETNRDLELLLGVIQATKFSDA